MNNDAAVTQSRAATILLGAAAGLSAIGAAVAVQRRRRGGRSTSVTALQSYLLDHLTGSDSAYGLVERLRRVQAGTSVGALAERLYLEFGQERRTVVALLHSLGTSSQSVKRIAGKAGSAAAQLASPSLVGDRPVFLALEALAVGVQGKRLLWRALEGLPLNGQWTFRKLEEQALRQWDDIETLRRGFARAVFDRR